MIFKAFKQKSNKKYLNKLLSNRHVNVNDSKLECLGIIINLDEEVDFERFKQFASYLNVHPNKLKIIAFSKSVQENLNTWDACYTPKDFGWKGSILNVELESFLNTKFDVLISYYTEEVLELKLLTTLSQSKLKIGILQTDERLNDLIIKTNIKEFDVFKTEVFKYLTILNKIKNE